MPATGPSPATINLILTILHKRGELGVTSREMMELTMSYHDVLCKLRKLGYSITASNANLPYPHHAVKRYVLVGEPEGAHV